ncbi:MAG: type II toxin-antitoxin system RelE/ParE family toxin [Leptospirales bacterium]
MEYEVLLTSEAEEFINSILDLKLKAKVLRTIDLLLDFGPYLSMPHSKSVKNGQGISELRTQQGNNIVRLFYFNSEEKLYVVTSGYVKKEQKLKQSEIFKAIEIMNRIME